MAVTVLPSRCRGRRTARHGGRGVRSCRRCGKERPAEDAGCWPSRARRYPQRTACAAPSPRERQPPAGHGCVRRVRRPPPATWARRSAGSADDPPPPRVPCVSARRSGGGQTRSATGPRPFRTVSAQGVTQSHARRCLPGREIMPRSPATTSSEKRRSERDPGREFCSRTGWTGAESVHPSVRELQTEPEETPFRKIRARLWPPPRH